MEETESQTKRDMLRLRDYDTLRSRYGEQYGNIPTEAELRKYVNTKKKMKKKGVSPINQSAMSSLINIVGTANHKKDIKQIAKTLSVRDAQEWIKKNKKAGWIAEEEDVDNDGISDVLVKDANGNLVIVNGYTLKPSTYPYRKLFDEEEDPKVRADYKTYEDYIRDVYYRPVYDGYNLNVESCIANDDKLALMQKCENANFQKIKPKNRSPYQAFNYNYIAPFYTTLVDRYNLFSAEGKRPSCYLQCVKYAWDKWVVRPALATLFGEDKVDEIFGDEKFMKKLKTNKQFKQLIETIVLNYFEQSDKTNSDLLDDLANNFIEIIDNWYEKNGIVKHPNYNTLNDEVRFESKLNESPLKTPKSYKKTRRTRRLLDSP